MRKNIRKKQQEQKQQETLENQTEQKRQQNNPVQESTVRARSLPRRAPAAPLAASSAARGRQHCAGLVPVQFIYWNFFSRPRPD